MEWFHTHTHTHTHTTQKHTHNTKTHTTQRHAHNKDTHTTKTRTQQRHKEYLFVTLGYSACYLASGTMSQWIGIDHFDSSSKVVTSVLSQRTHNTICEHITAFGGGIKVVPCFQNAFPIQWIIVPARWQAEYHEIYINVYWWNLENWHSLQNSLVTNFNHH